MNDQQQSLIDLWNVHYLQPNCWDLKYKFTENKIQLLFYWGEGRSLSWGNVISLSKYSVIIEIDTKAVFPVNRIHSGRSRFELRGLIDWFMQCYPEWSGQISLIKQFSKSLITRWGRFVSLWNEERMIAARNGIQSALPIKNRQAHIRNIHYV